MARPELLLSPNRLVTCTKKWGELGSSFHTATKADFVFQGALDGMVPLLWSTLCLRAKTLDFWGSIKDTWQYPKYSFSSTSLSRTRKLNLQ